jgi:N-acyl-D-amino-acid deacylase
MYDILITKGRLYDGTGAPWFEADVAVENGKIVGVGKALSGHARAVIDASGLAVAPGFIDIHTHSDSVFLANPGADSKVRQGVTFEVGGNCGGSVAPLTARTRESEKESLAESGVELTWSSMAEYFQVLEKNGMPVNFACLAGHGTIRQGVMGFDQRPPTADELGEMKRLVAGAMDDGALGMSTGLIYAPGSYADTPEIIELARVVAQKNGLYFTHMRNERDHLLDSVRETIEIGKTAGLPIQIAHHKVSNREHWGEVKQSLAMLEQARADGVDVTCDQYPYTASSTSLNTILPGWAHEGGREAMLARLLDPATREALKAVVCDEQERAAGWDRLIISKVQTEANKRFEGMSIAEVAALRGSNPCDTALDLLIEERCSVSHLRVAMCDEDVETVMKSRLVMVGSDGSSLADYGVLRRGKPHPRNFGAFVRVLGKYVREKHVLTLEDAIRKMTSLPAWRLGLWDRGVLRPGVWADITVFDPDKVDDVADFNEPFRYATGVNYVLVNGQITVDSGQYTGKKAGRVLRRRGTAA